MVNQKIPEMNIGVVGHIDHGKTTLLGKLTGKFADTHSEELKRGITIKLGYADTIIYNCKGEYKTNIEKPSKDCKPLRYVSFIDAPGHEMLMATMLSGSAIMDAAILLIAANEGIRPQTKEHFMALQSKNMKNIIIIQNKIDLVTKEKALENYKEIKNFVKGTFAENAPIIPVSAQQEINIEKILEEICKIKIPERDTKKEPLFLIARSFDINRPGAKISELKGGVLGGALKEGVLKQGDEIEIKPGISEKKGDEIKYKTIKTKVLSLYKGNEKIEKATPGVSVSIETSLDPFLTKTDSLSGCVASTTDTLPEISYKVKLKLNLFKEIFSSEGKQKVEELKTKETLMLNVNTTISVGVVESIKKDEVVLKLTIPIISLKRDTVGIARNIKGHWRLIGWGEIIE
ncbi:MAG: translation initiation factor IF-2 subunit gamma [Nanoarchaeota archaeon]